MVEQHDAAADVPSRGVVVRGDERPDPGIGAQDPRRGQRGGQLASLFEQQVHLIGRDPHVVPLVEAHVARGGADQRDRVAGDQDIGIGRLAAAVQDDAVHAMPEDQQRPLGREHVDRYVGHAGDSVAPDASGIDRQRGAVFVLRPAFAVQDADAGHAALFADESEHFVVGEDPGAVCLGIDDVGQRQAEGIHGPVRYADRTDDRWVYRRFHSSGQCGVDDFGPDSRLAARPDEGCLVVQVIFGQGDEQTVGRLHAVACNPAQDHVLADALCGRLPVGHCVARPAVQQPVVAAGGSRSEVEPLDQQHPQSAQGAIAGRSCTSRSASDDDDVVFALFLCFHTFCFLGCW